MSSNVTNQTETKTIHQGDITYQNKDVTSKFLAEHFKGKSFRVYGLDLPEIQEVQPTNLPTVQANELRIDNLFLLTDGTAAIVDYESDYEASDKVKYLNYLVGIARRYRDNREACPNLRMIVIYTGNVRRNSVSCRYDIGALQMEIEAAFLLELDSDQIFTHLKEKVVRKELLSEEELMEFIILPLSYPGKKTQKQKIRETVTLAGQISDPGQQLFTLAGLLTFTDKVMDIKTVKQVRRMIEMTQVARIFEEEKQQALREVEERYEKEKRQTAEKYKKEKRQTAEKYKKEKQQTAKQTVKKMIELGLSTENILFVVPDYSAEKIEQLRRETE